MPGKTARGRFVWHELMVPDTAKSYPFYEKVVGWKMQPFDQDPSYQMFATSSGPLGGAVAQPDGPPRWMPYIGTDDIEATVAQATQLGATALTEIAEIATSGRWASLRDPQGGEFAVYQSAHAPDREKPPKRGEFSWHELMTSDYQAAFDFYSQLFGWELIEQHDMGAPVGVYLVYGRNGAPLGGMFTLPAGMGPGTAWCGYVRVKDVHKAVKKATAAGATLINGPMEVPGGDWIAQLLDPQGAMFAVHALQVDVKPATPPDGPQQGALDLKPAEPVSMSVPAQPAAKLKSAAPKKSPQPAKAKAPAKPRPKAAPAKAAPKRKPAPKKTAGAKKKARPAPKKGRKAAKPSSAKRGRRTSKRSAAKVTKKKARRAK